jgi:uncharacterized membrane protein YphA (DoxX/SURF4 family)
MIVMNIFLWILQVLLALAFLAAGLTKVIRPKDKLRDQMAWVEGVPEAGVKLIGTAEILGALGLLLPPLLHILVILTPLAAVGLAIVMVGAIVTHVRLHEANRTAPAIVLLIMALIVAWGRFGPYHF